MYSEIVAQNMNETDKKDEGKTLCYSTNIFVDHYIILIDSY